ncbi:hypothetical protein VISI1226_22610 [Vibrio sinaloensis DSM 21326]|uniref:Uncharacterized protein n=1 Tax=Vibrio sinaloensis DSM 21326 TaxID=945550 RepID=E8MDS3_PHOS4|nr:hypothetical protein VISI1226_22610 [Vibrio sinaloensis DSM 21326]
MTGLVGSSACEEEPEPLQPDISKDAATSAAPYLDVIFFIIEREK